MVRVGPLTGEQRRALVAMQRRAVGRVAQRAHRVLLSARGYTVAQIVAEIVTTGRASMLEELREQIPPGLVEMLAQGRLSLHVAATRPLAQAATALQDAVAGRASGASVLMLQRSPL